MTYKNKFKRKNERETFHAAHLVLMELQGPHHCSEESSDSMLQSGRPGRDVTTHVTIMWQLALSFPSESSALFFPLFTGPGSLLSCLYFCRRLLLQPHLSLLPSLTHSFCLPTAPTASWLLVATFPPWFSSPLSFSTIHIHLCFVWFCFAFFSSKRRI